MLLTIFNFVILIFLDFQIESENNSPKSLGHDTVSYINFKG